MHVRGEVAIGGSYAVLEIEFCGSWKELRRWLKENQEYLWQLIEKLKICVACKVRKVTIKTTGSNWKCEEKCTKKHCVKRKRILLLVQFDMCIPLLE